MTKIDWVEVLDGYLVEIGTGEYRIDANEELQRRIMKALATVLKNHLVEG